MIKQYYAVQIPHLEKLVLVLVLVFFVVCHIFILTAILGACLGLFLCRAVLQILEEPYQ